jgi:BMFP domain-containing protein YqiC
MNSENMVKVCEMIERLANQFSRQSEVLMQFLNHVETLEARIVKLESSQYDRQQRFHDS